MTDLPLSGRRTRRWRDVGPWTWDTDPTVRSRRRGDRRDISIFKPRVDPVWRHVDLVLLLAAAGISALGALMVLSSTRGTDPDTYDLSFFQRQLTYVGIGLVCMVLVASMDYRRLRERGWLGYLAVVVLLGLVLTGLGTERSGTQAWFQIGGFQLQPAELAKVAVIVGMAGVLASRDLPLAVRWVGLSLGVLIVPMGLILLQPDLGTALVFVAIALGVLLVAGVELRHLVVVVAVGTLSVAWVLNSDMLEDYQRARLTTFLDQGSGDQEDGYNLEQSMIAVGSGGTDGRGLFNGTQTRLGIVPEQHTDFIFTALGEELGFLGCATMLGLFFVLCWRIWRTAQIARDRFGMLLCVGVLSMLVFQVFQNVGMTLGIMPITGIPLPFMSYGGSSTLTSWIAVGLVLNVHMRRYRST
jgi:rod shape determining protein RodA